MTKWTTNEGGVGGKFFTCGACWHALSLDNNPGQHEDGSNLEEQDEEDPYQEQDGYLEDYLVYRAEYDK